MNTGTAVQIAAIALFALLISAIVMRHFRVTWSVMVLGVLFYMAQAGAQTPFLAAVISAFGNAGSPVLLALLMALLFGSFEEGARWFGFIASSPMLRFRNWGAAVVYGSGHGAAEALRFIFLSGIIPGLSGTSPWPPRLLLLAISLDRVSAILFHCGWSTLVMYGVIRKRVSYLAAAIAGHVAIYWAVFVLLQQNRVLGAELVQALGALLAIAIALGLYTVWPLEEQAAERPSFIADEAIAVRDLTYVYPGDRRHKPVQAIRGLSLQVRRGRLLALLGHNGAGKTTTLRILGGLLSPTTGQASVAGEDVARSPDEVRKLVGLQSEVPGLYPHMSVAAYLNFFARLYDVPRRERIARIEELLTSLQLTDQRDAPAGSLSKGNRQKVALARTLIHHPQVLLLDEPTSGLDPAVSVLVRQMIAGLRRQGRTIVLATHNLFEAEALADDVAIVHRGLLIRHGPVAALENHGAKRFTVQLAPPHVSLGSALERLRQLDSISELHVVDKGSAGDSSTVSLSFCTPAPETANPEVLSTLLAMGLKPYALTESLLSLEQIYLDLDRQMSDENGASGEQR